MADYTSQFTGSQIDARLAKVPQLETALAGKQATLVSGENIATINNQSLLEGGNITVGGGGGEITVDSSLSSTSTNPVQNKVIYTALNGKQDTISDLATIRSGATAGATAVQPSALSALAPKASPQFTGTPTAPTAASGTNTTQIATTAFVQNAFSNTVILGDVIETI